MTATITDCGEFKRIKIPLSSRRWKHPIGFTPSVLMSHAEAQRVLNEAQRALEAQRVLNEAKEECLSVKKRKKVWRDINEPWQASQD